MPKGNCLWNVTVSEIERNREKVYILTSTGLTGVGFTELSKRALALARKDKDLWFDTDNLYVSKIEEGGSIDG